MTRTIANYATAIGISLGLLAIWSPLTRFLSVVFFAILISTVGGCAITVDTKGQEMIERFRQIADEDMMHAQRLAELNKDDAALACLKAIDTIRLEVRTWKAVGALTVFQAGMDITNPGGYLNVECAAERAAVKARIQLFIGSTATLLATFGL